MQKSKSNTVLADYFPAPVPEKLLIFTGVPEKKKQQVYHSLCNIKTSQINFNFKL